jgi:hypothetical protein
MFSRRMFLALAALLVFAAPSFAGSGGAKKDATITIRNDQAAPIAVFVGQDAVTKAAGLPANPTQAQIEAAGGVVVNPGKETSTKVVAGTYPVLAANAAGGNKSISVTLAKGQTKKYAFTNANDLVAY